MHITHLRKHTENLLKYEPKPVSNVIQKEKGLTSLVNNIPPLVEWSLCDRPRKAVCLTSMVMVMVMVMVMATGPL